MPDSSPFSDAYCQMVEDIIANDPSRIFDNYSFDHATFLSEKMFRKAEKSVSILTRHLVPEDARAQGMRREFCAMVRRLSELPTKPAVRVVTTGWNAIPAWADELQKETGRTLDIFLATEDDKEKSSTSHVFVIDGKMFRYEQPHAPDELDVHAKVSFDNPETAGRLQQQFNRLWDRLHTPAPVEH